jgi:hypothetical protein
MLNQDCLQKFQRDPALAPCWNEAFRIPNDSLWAINAPAIRGPRSLPIRIAVFVFCLGGDFASFSTRGDSCRAWKQAI